MTIGFKARIPQLLSLAGRPALGRVLVIPNFFYSFIRWRPLCSWGLSMLHTFFGTLLYRQFLRPHGLFFALTYTVNCGTVYRPVCAFPNHVQSIECTTGGLQSSYRNNSRMINRNRMHLSSISGLIAKCLFTYVNKVYLFFIFNTFANIYKNLFTL